MTPVAGGWGDNWRNKGTGTSTASRARNRDRSGARESVRSLESFPVAGDGLDYPGAEPEGVLEGVEALQHGQGTVGTGKAVPVNQRLVGDPTVRGCGQMHQLSCEGMNRDSRGRGSRLRGRRVRPDPALLFFRLTCESRRLDSGRLGKVLRQAQDERT